MSMNSERKESRLERSDRIAREYIEAERISRERKTARLRELRMKAQEA